MILLPSLVGMGDSRNIVELYDRLSISSSIHAMRTFLDVVIFRFSFFVDFAFRERSEGEFEMRFCFFQYLSHLRRARFAF